MIRFFVGPVFYLACPLLIVTGRPVMFGLWFVAMFAISALRSAGYSLVKISR